MITSQKERGQGGKGRDDSTGLPVGADLPPITQGFPMLRNARQGR